MITVKIMGGLGNQLFQYAFGRSLSIDLDTELFFDVSHFDTEYAKSIRHIFYSLNLFNIKENFNNQKFSDDNNDESSKLNCYQEAYFNEITDFPSYRNINKIQLPGYFNGFWQSEKYFFHNQNIIRNDLQLKNPIHGKNKAIANDILEHNSVALHIRRGDYNDLPHFGMCDTDYYKKSISIIEERVENPKFFIFADDHDWVKKNINISHPTYHITHNNVENGYEDLRLMSLCKHFIIANSTFSWWGAWLSSNDDKIVILPKPWLISRLPAVRYIDIGKQFIPILNDHSEVFNKSRRVLFRLDPTKYSSDISSIHNADLNLDKDMLDIHTTGDNALLYLKEIQKFYNNNEVIVKISIKPKSDDVIRLYYTTKKSSTHHENNSFFAHYYENEDVDLYIRLSEDVLLTKLMLVPASKEGSRIILKSLEIREIYNTHKYSSKFLNTISKKISTFRNI